VRDALSAWIFAKGNLKGRVKAFTEMSTKGPAEWPSLQTLLQIGLLLF
jgi:hypothetical protein